MKNTYKKVLTAALAAILIIGGTSVSSHSDSSFQDFTGLGLSQLGDETKIGSSGRELDSEEFDGGVDENISQATHSDILFQFREKGSTVADNLEVEIHLTGDINNVKMINTSDEEETKAPIKEENPASEDGYQIKDNLLYSQEDSDESIEVVPNLGLGYSVNITEVESTKVLESDSKVNFDLPEEGKYTFGLYDSENSLVANLLYNTRADLPGDISISVKDGFKVVDNNLQVIVDYVVPASTTPQKLIITLPPFYTLSGTPAPQNGITYKSSTLNFNEAHYENVEYGDKMLAYFQNAPATLRQSVFEISFANTVSGKISFTLTLTSNVGQKNNLSVLMAFFAENPDKIPLLIVAEAKNSVGEILNSATFHGTSTLTDALGSPVENIMTYPDKDIPKTPQSFYRALKPYASIPSSKYPLLSAPHYPYYDVVRLYPYVENAAIGTGEEIVIIDGKNYISVPENSTAFKYFQTPFSTTSSPALSIKLPHANYLKAGTNLPGGPVYLEYTYKGQRVREIEYMLNDYPVGKIISPTSIISYKTPTGVWNGSVSYMPHTQGKKDQQFKIDVANSAVGSFVTSPTQAALPAVYRDVAITLEIPFEFKLKDISYSTSASYIGHPLLTQMQPSLVEYTTFGGDTGTISVPPGSSDFAIPAEAGHVKLLVFHYDLWVYNMSNAYIITVDIGTKNEVGAPIPDKQLVYIKPSFSTANNDLVELYDAPGETTSPFSMVATNLPVRLVEVADGIRFGTYSGSSNPVYRGDFYTSVRAYNETTTAPTSGTVITKTDGGAPWKFAFKSVANMSKDYDDVKIIIEADTDDEKKALSKMAGMQSTITVGTHTSQYEIFIKTNLAPEGKTITPTGKPIDIPFEIADNEYVTYLELRLGTLYGSAFTNMAGTYDDGEKIYLATINIQPTFRTERYYFTGTDKQEMVCDGETQHLIARVETSSESKYMDPNSSEYLNSTSTSTANFIPYVDVKFKRHEITSARWSSGNTFYQGATFNFSFVPAVHSYLNGSTNLNASYTEMVFPSYDHQMYLEVVEGFEIISVAGYDFVEKKPLPDTNSNLFVFKTNTQTHGDRISLVGYVRPDAPVMNNIEIVKNLGFDYQAFKDKYL